MQDTAPVRAVFYIVAAVGQHHPHLVDAHVGGDLVQAGRTVSDGRRLFLIVVNS